MPDIVRRRSAIELLISSIRSTIASPSLWMPALALLLPTLAFQLAAPTYLRTRLSPSPWFVLAGSLALVLLAQIVMPAIFAMVHARRIGMVAPPPGPTLAASAGAGVRTFLGLLCGVLPGLWLQARYAFAAFPIEGGKTSATPARGAIGRLMTCGVAALIASALGQSLVAVLNDALGVVRAAGSIDGRTVFQLDYASHAATTVIAYVCAAGAATCHAVGVSMIHEETDAVSEGADAIRSATPAMMPATRLAIAASLALLVAGVAAAVYKIQQHVF
jgi:hypothetical protein